MRATWLYLAGLTVSLVIFTMAIFLSIRPVVREPWPPAAAAGKKVWQARGCVECHTLLGNGGYAAGDLTRVTTTAGRQEILTFLTQPSIMRPSWRQLHPALTREEAERVLVVHFKLTPYLLARSAGGVLFASGAVLLAWEMVSLVYSPWFALLQPAEGDKG